MTFQAHFKLAETQKILGKSTTEYFLWTVVVLWYKCLVYQIRMNSLWALSTAIFSVSKDAI